MYRLGVGIVLLNKKNQVFLGARKDQTESAWQMPQGGIDGNEPPYAAAQRELLEETGIEKTTYIAETKNWLSYDFPHALKKSFFGGQYIGQKQKWFLLRFDGKDDDINIQTDTPEFKMWMWGDFNSLNTNAVLFKHLMYKKIMTEFSTYIL